MSCKSAVLLLMICGACVSGGWGQLCAEESPPGDEAILRLASGDFITGRLGDSATPDVINWYSPDFTGPLAFPVGRVVTVHFPVGQERPQPTGDYCVELSGGDQLFGNLVSLTADNIVLDVKRFGRLKIQRSHIRRILSWGKGAEVVYQGPRGLQGWDHSDENAKWTDEGGQLVTDAQDAFLHGDVGIPAQAGIEFEISWKEKADFVIAFGVDNNPKNIQQAFRIEVWEQDLVLMRETDDEVDVTSLLKLKPNDGRLHLQAYLDQKNSRIFVYTADGRRLGDLEVARGNGAGKFTYPAVRLMNKRGDLRLERLRITEWNGEAPHNVQGETSRTHLADGTILNGGVESYDPEARQFIVLKDKKPVRIDENQVVSFSMPAEIPEEPRAINAIFPDNNRLSGSIVKIEDGKLSMKCPGIVGNVVFPVADLHSLASTQKNPPAPAGKEREGRLEIDGLRLRGHLVDGRGEGEASCLVFHPREASSGSPLRIGVAGRIVYRDPPPPEPQQPVQQRGRVIRRRGGFWGNVIEKLSTGESSASAQVPAGRAIHLRTGDVIPGTVKQIDERGVYFDSGMTDAKFVPNEKVKAVEFVKAQSTIRFSKDKRERLLTLPRMQKHNPPTHLIRSIKGDYLRGRVVGMDDEYLTVEVRLENKRIPRANVSRIIWLHGDNLEQDESKPEDEPAPTPTAAMRVQALRSDSNRLTFEPLEVAGATLSGTSDVLGKCQVEIRVIDQLIFGAAIEAAAAKLTYHQWTLQNAVEPKYLSATDIQGTGLESAMVGQAAPDFTLKLLEGGDFHLDDYKGKIVVLDFWATWCGPCMQSMPHIVGVAREFEDQQVQLIAVNLEEDPQRIRATLERLKLDPQVVLDQDGAVADKYSATSIPQTVIIDREGKIARLFVGGGPQIGEQLRTALQEVVSGKARKKEEPAP